MKMVRFGKFHRGASFGLMTIGLAACSSLFGDPATQVRAVDIKSGTVGGLRDGLYYSAVTAINRRDYGRALDYLQEAKSRDGNDVRVLNALGVVYDKLGRFDLSARYYAQARMVEPNSNVVSRNVAYSDMLQGMMGGNRLASIPPSKGQLVAKPQPITTSLDDVAILAAPSETAAASIKSAPADTKPSQATAVAVLAHDAPIPPAASPVLSSVAGPVDGVLALKTKDTPHHALPIRAPVLHAAVVPSPPVLVKKEKVLTIGHPFEILDASGRIGMADAIGGRLAQLGWTVRQSPTSRVLKTSELFYPPENATAAVAMQRTLPFPVRLTVDGKGTMRLVVGTDYLSWKPKNARLANLWQKNKIVVAVLPKSSAQGAR